MLLYLSIQSVKKAWDLIYNDAIPLLRNNPCMSKCMECEMTNLLYDDRS